MSVDISKKPARWLEEKVQAADIRAVQDLEQGIATSDQQKRALSYIINNLCATYQPSYRVNQRDSDFMEGRRFVGLELVTLLKLNASAITRGENK